MINEETQRKIKEAANIVDVVGEFVKLHKKGVNYEGICPFHEDRTLGSFVVSQAKNVCNCFACGTRALDPVGFLMKKEGMGYHDALRWLAGRYGIECEGADRFVGVTYEKREPAPPKELLEIPKKWVRPTMKGLEDNTLVKWLTSLPWDDVQRDRIMFMLNLYCVGHWSKEGHTMFWQIDHECKIRTGKMMKYKPDGHRDKESDHNFDWIHAWLGRRGFYNTDLYTYSTCYFGSHLLNGCPDATINLVESEKTALICAIAYGDPTKHLWLATGGKQFFTRWKMEPLIKLKRKVVLYPDRDAEEEWKKLAEDMHYEHMTVNTDFMSRYWKPEDGKKADIADVIVRMLQEQKPTTIEDVKAKWPKIAPLIDKLDLEIDNGR